jgi:bifunctional non-homologous end joining protein LigD/DNA ligase-1
MMDRFLPMLAVRGEPFDSPEYLFEVKWNGVRALAASASGRWQLWGREQGDYQDRYPELEPLSRLPSGTVVDGELVLLSAGVPDLDALQRRHHLSRPGEIQQRSRRQPVTYVLFDLLVDRGQSLLGQPLVRRREVLQQLVQQLGEPRLAFSEGVLGWGRVFFEQAVRQGQEGVMAKHLSSRYVPGRRSAAWKKLKPGRWLAGVVVGYVPGVAGVQSVLVAALHAGGLRYVAQVRSGFGGPERRRLQGLLQQRIRVRPVVECPCRGIWVEPELYCRIGFLEWTRAGRLRGARFRGLLAAPAG